MAFIDLIDTLCKI